jgi:flagellar biosynthesis protein FlhF
MNLKRFAARTSREALALVRKALGDDAVVLSTRPAQEGVEVLAMAPEAIARIEQASDMAASPRAPQAAPAARERLEPRMDPAGPTAPAPATDPGVEGDVRTLAMSTLSFQDYVRNRMLERRRAELAQAEQAAAALPPQAAAINPGAVPLRALARADLAVDPAPGALLDDGAPRPRRDPPVLRREVDAESLGAARRMPAPRDGIEVIGELRSVRHLIEERFGTLAFLERLQRDPRQAALAQKLFDAGLSPGLVRRLVQALPADAGDEAAWAAGVLERNLATDENEAAIEDHPGAFALIGATGVGKTTSTAKIAAAFATRHGAANLGLITLDAYRVAAHEQLRAYGRILGVPVHTAHDRESLLDLLELLSAKRLVLIDTAGIAQRDSRAAELLEMLSHPAIHKLLVVNAAAQGETIEDVMVGYDVASCRGVVVSKLDEALKIGPALDALIRHKAKVVGVANGQRVPEDWHRLSAQALVQRALRGGGGSSWRLDPTDISLVLAGTRGQGAAVGAAA